MASARRYCPARASASATGTSARDRELGSVIEQAAASACVAAAPAQHGDDGSLLMVPSEGQGLRDLGQSARPGTRTGGQAGYGLGLLVLPCPGKRPRDLGAGKV